MWEAIGEPWQRILGVGGGGGGGRGGGRRGRDKDILWSGDDRDTNGTFKFTGALRVIGAGRGSRRKYYLNDFDLIQDPEEKKKEDNFTRHNLSSKN